MLVAHKIRIYPNQEQKNLIDKSCATQGFIYNWGLNEWQQQYKNGLKQQFWKEHTFWSDGYFVCSIGEANPETIRKYIENQG